MYSFVQYRHLYMFFPCVCFNVTLESRREMERCIALVIWTLVSKYPMGLFMLLMTIYLLKFVIVVSACEMYSWVICHNVVVQSTLCIKGLAAYDAVEVSNMSSWYTQAIALNHNLSWFPWFCRFHRFCWL